LEEELGKSAHVEQHEEECVALVIDHAQNGKVQLCENDDD